MAKYLVATPESTRIAADLINRYPDRFLFGTDEVAPQNQEQYLRVYYQYQPLWKLLDEKTREKVLKGNYERIFDGARHKVRAWEIAQGFAPPETPDDWHKIGQECARAPDDKSKFREPTEMQLIPSSMNSPSRIEKVTAMGAKRNFSNVIIHAIRELTAILCIVVLVPGNAMAVQTQQPATPTQQPATKLPPEQLDSLVAPIALYPDPLLSQTLVASTYPLEVIQLKQWLDQHKDLKDKALADAVQKQDWDPSIQAMAALPDVVKQLADNIKWTADLGNAFLAQQNDVMDAVQRMRKKASDAGNLKSSEQQKVETKVVENKQVIVIEQANPQVIYVPSYNPTVVYGPPVYPYPPIYYPPVGYYAAGMAISFGDRYSHGSGVGRWLGLRLRMGWQQ